MTDSGYDWMKGMAAAYRRTPENDDDEPEKRPGIIKEVRDDSPFEDEEHVRIVLKDENDDLVDVGNDRVEVIQ